MEVMRRTRRQQVEGREEAGLDHDEKLGADFAAKGDRQAVLHDFFTINFDPRNFAPLLHQAAREARAQLEIRCDSSALQCARGAFPPAVPQQRRRFVG